MAAMVVKLALAAVFLAGIVLMAANLAGAGFLLCLGALLAGLVLSVVRSIREGRKANTPSFRRMSRS
jgi:hypothetical protein